LSISAFLTSFGGSWLQDDDDLVAPAFQAHLAGMRGISIYDGIEDRKILVDVRPGR
jgi:hypothetical protein